MTGESSRGKNDLHLNYEGGSLTSRKAISTLSVFQLLIMKYLVSSSLQSAVRSVFLIELKGCMSKKERMCSHQQY